MTSKEAKQIKKAIENLEAAKQTLVAVRATNSGVEQWLRDNAVLPDIQSAISNTGNLLKRF